jgi:hypothetical protein
MNDEGRLLAAGTPEGWGIALISGTGSIVYGSDREGHTARAGGLTRFPRMTLQLWLYGSKLLRPKEMPSPKLFCELGLQLDC